MFFVCLSHFATSIYGRKVVESAAATVLWKIGLVASPAFVLISGMMLGYLYASAPEGFPAFRRKLIDRGVFLLVPGHILIAVAHLQYSGGVRHALEWLFMTDAIGVSIIIGPLLVDRVKPRGRVVLAGVLFAVAWGMAIVWQPTGFAGRLAHDTLFGPGMTPVYLYSFPLLHWFALYLAASALGEKLAAVRRRESDAGMIRALVRVGVVSIASAAALRAAAVVAQQLYRPSWTADLLSSPFQKLPPSPVFLLVYGGAALFLFAGIMAAEQRKVATWLVGTLDVVGRTSLFAFVLQYYVYYVVLDAMDFRGQLEWAGAFALSLVVVGGLCHLWNRGGYNRFITVGLRRRAPD